MMTKTIYSKYDKGLIGDLPVSSGRAWGWFAGISGAVAAAMAAILYFL